MKKKLQPKRILIARTDRLGDVILSTPVIKNIRKTYPSSHIAFLCRPYTKEVLEGNPHLNQVIIYDKYGRQKKFLSTLAFAFRLRKKRFDLAIILHPTNRAHILTFFAGIPQRVGWDKKMGFLLTDKLTHKKSQGQKHEIEYNFDLLKYLNIPVKNKELYFPLKEKSLEKIITILKEKNIKKKDKLIVIHPSASCPSKRWPQENFIKLIKKFKKKEGIKIAAISAPDQIQFVQQIIKEKEIINLCGKLSISEVAALLKKASLFISCDSGPVHIAAALNTPVISIFGRNQPSLSPKRWAPSSKNSHFLHKNTDCDPCLAHNCQKNFKCLAAITPLEVYNLSSRFI